MTEDAMVEVIQADRDAAADFLTMVGAMLPGAIAQVRDGSKPWQFGLVQAFARHRIAAEARQHGDGGREPRSPCAEDHALAAACGPLCEDCPPVGYPTDKTRCLPCPRRTSPALPDTTAIQGLKDALWEQTGLVELLCDIVDCVAEDVGHGTGQSIDSVLALLGPCNDRALEALAAVGLRPDRGEIISALEGADHG